MDPSQTEPKPDKMNPMQNWGNLNNSPTAIKFHSKNEHETQTQEAHIRHLDQNVYRYTCTSVDSDNANGHPRLHDRV